MTEEPKPLRDIVWVPLCTLGLLLAAVATTLVYAYLPGAPLKPAVGVAIAAFKIVLIAIFFMRLKQASVLVRLTAGAGLAWASLLFIIGFCDYLARLGPTG